jgi:small GTP-binding protein
MTPGDTASYTKKVCLVGDPEVGKTSLVRRFVIDKYDDAYIQTIGAKVTKKNVQVKANENTYDVTLMLWDVMGQKHFKIIESVAFQHIQGAFVVCDMTRKSTLDNVKYWVDALQKVGGKTPIIILANKIDLSNLAEYEENDVARVAAELGAQYYTTSAKTGANVEKAFSALAKASLKGAIQ